MDLKECLRKLKFPTIDNMNEEEVGNLLVKDENRIHLLSWAVKLLYNISMDGNPREIEKKLAATMYECGFCLNSEKFAFVKAELPIPRQIDIFTKLFNFMLTGRVENDEHKTFKKLFDELDEFQNLDLNLFPEEGCIKKLSSEQENVFKGLENTVQEFKNKIEDLKSNQSVTLVSTEIEKEVMENDVKANIAHIHKELTKLQANMPENLECNLQFSKQFLYECNTETNKMETIKKHLQLACALEKFKTDLARQCYEDDNEDTETLEDLNEIASNINKIAEDFE